MALRIILCSIWAVATNEEGLAFLAEKEKEDGVIKLPSGLLYKVLNNGSGLYHPKAATPCECHYKGTLINGTQFDSSYDRGQPTTFAPNQVIKGWTEAMQLMVEGDKWEMYIPSELAYGENGSPPKIPPESALVFQMEIIKVTGAKKTRKKGTECDYETAKNCSPEQEAIAEEYTMKEFAEVKSAYTNLKKQRSKTLKKAERAEIDKNWALLRPYYVWRRKQDTKQKREAEL